MSSITEDLIADILEIQGFSKLLLTRPNRAKFNFYKKELLNAACEIAKIEFDNIYKEPELTEISLAVSLEDKKE